MNQVWKKMKMLSWLGRPKAMAILSFSPLFFSTQSELWISISWLILG